MHIFYRKIVRQLPNLTNTSLKLPPNTQKLLINHPVHKAFKDLMRPLQLYAQMLIVVKFFFDASVGGQTKHITPKHITFYS